MLCFLLIFFFFFFFQAEDGIRDHCVTGVQTCALPIFLPGARGIHSGISGGNASAGNSEQHSGRITRHSMVQGVAPWDTPTQKDLRFLLGWRRHDSGIDSDAYSGDECPDADQWNADERNSSRRWVVE